MSLHTLVFRHIPSRGYQANPVLFQNDILIAFPNPSKYDLYVLAHDTDHRLYIPSLACFVTNTIYGIYDFPGDTNGVKKIKSFSYLCELYVITGNHDV